MDFTLTPEQAELKRRAVAVAESFADEVRGWDESDDAPYGEIFARVGEAELFGIAMPEEFGGKGGGAIEYLLVVEALFRHSQSWLPPEPVFCTSGPGPVDAVCSGTSPSRRSTCMRSWRAGVHATSP